MKVYQLFMCITIVISGLLGNTTTARAQSGDQMLDGIGETGLIARYVFDGNADDWSRNNLHARVHGPGASYVQDLKFGKVLSLPGQSETYVSIPAEAMGNIESLSITGWIYLRSDEQGQRIFDFGRDEKKTFFANPTGDSAEPAFQTSLTAGKDSGHSLKSKPIKTDKWVHFAVVFDAPSETLVSYVNGKEVARTTDINFGLDDVIANDTPESNLLLIGKSQALNNPNLDAKLYDFRIYSIPLDESQLTRIYKGALGEGEISADKAETSGPGNQFENLENPLYAAYLQSVPDVEVETTVGELPRLPRYVEGTYSEGIDGPHVRILWPAPTDNSSVLKPGRYSVTGAVSGTDFHPVATVTVLPETKVAGPERALEPFPLDQVLLNPDSKGNDTKFIENRDKFINTLAGTDPDSFLYMFRNAFGQEQPEGAVPLGVWDSQETKLRGHATGHYMTAIAQAYAGTGYDPSLKENFKNKMEYVINTLYDLSQRSGKPRTTGGDHVSDPTKVPPAEGKSEYDSDLSEEGIRTDYWNWGKGFISAYPPDQFIMLESGASYGGQKDQVWAPYYTLHKILAGLMDIYEVSGDVKALEIAKGMSDWVYARLRELPEETLIKMWNSYIAGEYGGMNEAMARLYRLTDEDRYLEAARMFDNIEVFFGDAQHSHGLADNVDTFRGKHANQHIPQIVGALEMYRDSNEPEYYKVADNFWYKVRHDYMYSIGGVAGASNPANAECFTSQPATLFENGLAVGGQNETCATYNMLKLTRNLFLYDQQGDYMDYYEQGLYNQILASVAENSPANTYHIPLNPGSVKHFGNPHMKGFTCCNGTAIESSTKLQNTIYFKGADNQELYVNLYIPSTLKWEERDIIIDQATSFPYDDMTKLTVRGEGKFDLNVRVPSWATEGFFVKINGKEQQVEAEPGTYLTLSRQWENGDTVELRMPFSFRLESVMDQPNIASLFYGPVLLAAEEPEPRVDWNKISLNAEDLGKSIKGNPETLQFSVDGVNFKPFFETYDRYSVYLDVSLK